MYKATTAAIVRLGSPKLGPVQPCTSFSARSSRLPGAATLDRAGHFLKAVHHHRWRARITP